MEVAGPLPAACPNVLEGYVGARHKVGSPAELLVRRRNDVARRRPQ